jgi:hypothetical protein
MLLQPKDRAMIMGCCENLKHQTLVRFQYHKVFYCRWFLSKLYLKNIFISHNPSLLVKVKVVCERISTQKRQRMCWWNDRIAEVVKSRNDACRNWFKDRRE